jgi:D-alanyl-D-alanine carboxypeptidase
MKTASTTLIALGVFLVSLIGTSLYLREFNGMDFAAVSEIGSEAPASPHVVFTGIQAESFIIETASGGVVAERNAGEEHAIASLTKVMVGFLTREYGEGHVVLITPESKSVPPKHSSLAVGMKLSAEAAREIMLVESDNDIAEAIAASLGSVLDPSNPSPRAAFIHAMNEKAKRLGMIHTHFTNPTGLDAEDHFSTAADVARLVNYITQRYPTFWDVTAEPPRSVRTESGAAVTISTTNILHNYPGLVGAKTGLTDVAEGALILRYRILEYPEDFTIVILRSPDRFGDGERILNQLRSALKRNS